MKKGLIIIASLVVLIGIFVVLRSQNDVKLPIDRSGESQLSQEEMSGISDMKGFNDSRGITNVKSFSNSKKNATLTANGTPMPKAIPTVKPLPYPRISINYSTTLTRSIGSVTLDKNMTFVLVSVDIRNYGYKYFDAHLNNFRMGKSGELIPLTNVSTGRMVDSVIPNNSRAKGDIIFILGKKVKQGKLVFSPANKSESYYIIYRTTTQSDVYDIKNEVVNDNSEYE
jgi:hypothetical protein